MAVSHRGAISFGMVHIPVGLYTATQDNDIHFNQLPAELLAYLKEKPAYNLQILLKTEENAEALTRCAPFTEDYPIPKQGVMYYLCENGACKAPVPEFSQLEL